MKKKATLVLLAMLTVFVGFSQEKDSIKTVELKEVLIQHRQAIFGSKQKQVNTGASGYYLSPKELQLFNYFDVHQQLQLIPGVNIQQEEGFGLRPRISFRGVAPGRSDKITLMEDGVLIAPAPYSSPAAYYFPTAGRMYAFEVLKGSSQIKYGPQTTAGVINMLSTPIPTRQAARVDMSWGQYNTKTIHAYAGNTYQNFGYLIETYQYGSDGFKQLDYGEGKDTGFDKADYMAKFMWKTTEGASVPQSLLLKLQYANEESDETYLGLTQKDFDANPYRRYASSQLDEMKTNHQVYSLTHNIKPAANIDITTTAYQTKFHRNWYKLGGLQNKDGKKGAKISSVLANPDKYKDAYEMLIGKDTEGKEAHKVKANNRNYDVKGVQTELNWGVNTSYGKHHITFGARYHYDKIDRYQWEDAYAMKDKKMSLIAAGKKGDAGNRTQESQAFATYLQYEFQMNNLTVTPGIRYENIKQYRNEYGKGNADRKKDPKYRENTTKVLLPGVSVQYKLDNGVQLFTGIHKGFAPAGNTPKTKDEKSYNYELGTRYTTQRLNTELVLFRSDYSNLLGEDLVAKGGTGTAELFNAGKALAQGVELLASYELVKTNSISLPVMMTYTFTDVTLKSDFDGAWGKVKSGDQMPYIAKHQVGLISSLQHDKYEFTLSGKYQSDMRTKAGQGEIKPSEKVRGILTVDMSAKYHVTNQLSVRATVTNLLNSKYEVARSPYGLRPGRPAMFNVGVAFNL